MRGSRIRWAFGVLFLILCTTAGVDAAVLVATADGNLTTAATWESDDSTSRNVPFNGSVSALSTSNQDSSTFTPGAITVDGFAMRLGVRASGSPTNTMTVTLRNSTDSADVQSCVINVSDLPVADATNDQGGWFKCKFNSSSLLIAAKAYLIRAKLSATSTAVSLYTSGGTNFHRMLITTTTATPAAGDNMHIMHEFDNGTNPATRATRSVTMDSTANTDYGDADTRNFLPAFTISSGGTLTFGTATSTTYIMRLSGHLGVYNGGTLNIGTNGTPIPGSSTATLQFDCTGDNNFSLWLRDGSTTTIYGASRTRSWTLLTANLAATGTSLTVADDTGWLNGDSILIASTSGTISQTETKTLSGDAGASSMTISAGATNAHGGSATSKIQAEVALVTRNVSIEATTSTLMYQIDISAGASFTAKWAQFRHTGGPGGTVGITVRSTTAAGGSTTFQYCYFTVSDSWIMYPTGTAAYTIDSNVFYNPGGNGSFINDGTGAWSITNNVFLSNNASGTHQMWIRSLSGTMSGNRTQGAGQCGVAFDQGSTSGTLTNQVSHDNNLWGMCDSSQTMTDTTWSGGIVWRNGSEGLRLLGFNQRFVIDGFTVFGNSVNIDMASNTTSDITIRNSTIAGDTVNASATGIQWTGATTRFQYLRIENTTFGVSSGSYNGHTTADLLVAKNAYYYMDAINVTFGSTTELTCTSSCSNTFQTARGSYFTDQKHDQTAGLNKVITPYGVIAESTSTCDSSPCLKMTPISATIKLDTAAMQTKGGWAVYVTNGQTPTISVKVQKDASYNGNAPRLVLKANPALGINTDTVLDTLSVGSGSYETLSAAVSAVNDDGVLQFVVDCDGTAGNIYVDTASVTGASAVDASTFNHWLYGLPVLAIQNVPASGGEASFTFAK